MLSNRGSPVGLPTSTPGTLLKLQNKRPQSPTIVLNKVHKFLAIPNTCIAFSTLMWQNKLFKDKKSAGETAIQWNAFLSFDQVGLTATGVKKKSKRPVKMILPIEV